MYRSIGDRAHALSAIEGSLVFLLARPLALSLAPAKGLAPPLAPAKGQVLLLAPEQEPVPPWVPRQVRLQPPE